MADITGPEHRGYDVRYVRVGNIVKVELAGTNYLQLAEAPFIDGCNESSCSCAPPDR